MLFRMSVRGGGITTWLAVAAIVLTVNAAIYSAIGLGIYFFFQWLGGQL